MRVDPTLGYAAALARLDARIEREIQRLRARYQLSLDEFRGLYVGDEQVDGLLRRSPDDSPPRAADDAITTALATHARWVHLAATFGLSDLEQDLLLIALAPEVDLKYETLYAYLNDDVTRKWPTADLASRLLSSAHITRPEVVHALSPVGALRRERLVLPIDPPATRPSLLNSGYALHAGAARFLNGVPLTAEDPRTPAPTSDALWTALPCSRAQVERLRRIAALIAARNGDAPVLILSGPPGCGRTAVARAIAAATGLPFRMLDARSVRHAGGQLSTVVADTALDLRLEPAALCVSGLESIMEADGRWLPDAHGMLAEFDRVSAPVLVVAPPHAAWPDLLGARRAHLVDLQLPDYDRRLELWTRHLDAAAVPLSSDERCALADRFAFSAPQIAGAVATAADWAAIGDAERVDGALVRRAARAQPRVRLGSLATVVRCVHGWRDVVLPPVVLSRLQEIAAAIHLRHVVYTDWAFARRFSGGTGVKAMFAGVSGTGKTMAAGVIAREVGLDLVKIDLSAIVSKYIGETEKHLDQVFAGARAGNSLLFFDEADAIFGKRSEVKDAHDRYANIEVAYLLQKLEEHDGVVILATNLRRNIDDAFSRRMHYVVDFPQPDVTERERLWRGMFPAEAPVSDDIDFAFLARQFELAGGDIRNVVLDAAFLAAGDRQPIGMPQLVRAVARQLTKQGKSAPPSTFQRYHALLTDHAIDIAAERA
jgi:AAA+ superfamily predicted ATPase